MLNLVGRSTLITALPFILSALVAVGFAIEEYRIQKLKGALKIERAEREVVEIQLLSLNKNLKAREKEREIKEQELKREVQELERKKNLAWSRLNKKIVEIKEVGDENNCERSFDTLRHFEY